MAGLVALLAVLPVAISATIAGDFSQFIYKPTYRQLYLAYRYRWYIIGMSLGLWLLALFLHNSGSETSIIWLAISLVLVLVFAVAAFIAVPFIVFTGIRNGKWISAEEADKFLDADTSMLTVVVNGDARAVAQTWMIRAHYWEDVVGGETVNLTFCPLSNTTVAFNPEINGEHLHLIVPSQIENNLVLYDTINNNLVQQIDGSIREGKHKGAVLDTYPSQMMSWSAWKALHPDTKVLVAEPQNISERISLFLIRDVFVKRHKTSGRPLFPTIDNLDTRQPYLTEVVGLVSGQHSKAFTLDYLRGVRVMNTDIGGQPIVLINDTETDTQFVYSREHTGQVLTFEPTTTEGAFQLKDNTGKLWQISGKRVEGDEQLTVTNHMSRAFWFTWANFYPETELISA